MPEFVICTPKRDDEHPLGTSGIIVVSQHYQPFPAFEEFSCALFVFAEKLSMIGHIHKSSGTRPGNGCG